VEVLESMARNSTKTLADFGLYAKKVESSRLARDRLKKMKRAFLVLEGYRIKLEGKSAIRYTGHVHIPPHPVVQYIIRETIGNLIREKRIRVEISQSLILPVVPGSSCLRHTGSF
jgi:hypothetical protein